MNRIFLAQSFRDEDRKLVNAILTVIESHGPQAVTGQHLGGQALTTTIRQRIAKADGLVAVMTPRDPKPNGRFTTHPWVRDELNHARSCEKPAVAFVDTRVELDGAYQEDEYIPYDLADPVGAFVKLSATIGEWKRDAGQRLKVHLLPDEVACRLAQHRALRCEYRFSSDGESSPWQPARVLLEPGGLYAYLRGATAEALVEVRLQAPDEEWCSVATPQCLSLTLARNGAR